MNSGNRNQKIPFTFLKVGEEVTVVGIKGDPVLKKRFLDLGIIPGSEIEFVNGGRNLPCVIRVNGGRIMIGWDALTSLTVAV